MIFWAVAAILGLASAGVILRAVLRAPSARAGAEGMQVYRDQLAEIESDLARGVLTEGEAAALRTEVSRRLLAAAETGEARAAPAPQGATGTMLALVAVLVLGGGLGLYALIGGRAAPDMPLARRIAENAAAYAERPSQAEAEAIIAQRGETPAPPADIDPRQIELLDQLKTVLKERPDDLRGHELLAQNMARLGNWPEAAAAQRDILRIKGSEATGTDQATLAEFLILAVNGYVSPEAEAALEEALALDPREPRARYYSGLSAAQAGRFDIAYELWVRLLSESRPEAPWVQAIASQIRDVALAAGRPVPEIPGAARGPSAEDMAAAADMSPEDREQMIRGMVAGLSDRLATEGGPAEDWARLIRAYGVLGETAQASRIWTEAQQVFADAPADLSIIRQAAREAEVAQ